jgi:hypothetical protein
MIFFVRVKKDLIHPLGHVYGEHLLSITLENFFSSKIIIHSSKSISFQFIFENWQKKKRKNAKFGRPPNN